MFKEKMKEHFKKFSNFELMGGYIKKYNKLYIILLFVVAVFELLLFIRELFLVRSIPLKHYLYLASYILLFVASVSSGLFVLFESKKNNNEKRIVFVIHIYAVIALVWGVSVSLLDYLGGNEIPVVFITILATIGGILVLNPFVYFPFVVVSVVVMFVGMNIINPEYLRIGNIINISILFLMIMVVSYRTTIVAVNEEEQRKALVRISTFDVLTDLKNENAYYRYLDSLDQLSKQVKLKYAVVVMDVNGLKFVDDTYGHNYGAHLIRTAGLILPTVFKNCEIFHTGGDEFVCIIVDEFDKLDEFLVDFSNKLEYQIINFEGQDLILSLARGVAVHKDGEKYNDTYQRADRDMYVNKPLIKEKYNIKGR